MKKEKFKIIVSVYLLLMRNDKVFLQKRKGTGFRDGQWGLIAGHHDGEQSLRQAIAREAKEEADIQINPSDLEFVHALHKRENDERLEIFFRTHKWIGEPVIAEPNKSDAIEWFYPGSLPERTIDYIAQVIQLVEKGEYYSEYGFEKS